MLEKYPEVMTLKQCQEVLGICKNVMLDLIHEMQLPAFRAGNQWRVCKDDLLRFMRNKL